MNRKVKPKPDFKGFLNLVCKLRTRPRRKGRRAHGGWTEGRRRRAAGVARASSPEVHAGGSEAGPEGGGEAAPTGRGRPSVWPTRASPGSNTRPPGGGQKEGPPVRHVATKAAATPGTHSSPRSLDAGLHTRLQAPRTPATPLRAGGSVAAGGAVPAAQAHPGGVPESTGHPLPGRLGHGPEGKAGPPVRLQEGRVPVVRVALS